jgi:outer membrane protein with beta-barrel domain
MGVGSRLASVGLSVCNRRDVKEAANENPEQLIGTAMLVLIAAPAFAQRGEVGVGVGATTPVGTLNDETDPGFVIDGFGSWPIHGMFGVRASGAYDGLRPAEDDRDACKAAGFDCMNRVGRVDGGVEVARRESRARPYGFAEIGAYNVKEEAAVGGAKVSESETHLGGGFGIGLRTDLGRRLGVGGEMPIRWWQEKEAGERETYWYFEPNAFVYVRF